MCAEANVVHWPARRGRVSEIGTSRLLFFKEDHLTEPKIQNVLSDGFLGPFTIFFTADIKVDRLCRGLDFDMGSFLAEFSVFSASTRLQSPPTVHASQVKAGKMKISAGGSGHNVNYSPPM